MVILKCSDDAIRLDPWDIDSPTKEPDLLLFLGNVDIVVLTVSAPIQCAISIVFSRSLRFWLETFG